MAVEEKKADAPDKENADAKGKGKSKKKGEKVEDDLSPEDEELKTQMELLVTRAQDKELEIRKAALQAMVKEIRTATSSMTSVPKPLKFLGPHYVTLKESYEGASADETKVMLADVLSMLAMTNAEPGVRESLSFKLKGTPSELATWGHEYVRHLSGEIAEEYNERLSDETGAKGKAVDLMPLIVDHMVPFFIEHNAEAEAIDLLSEVGTIDSLVQHVDKTNCERIVMYLSQVAQYVPEPEDAQVLGVAVAALRKIGRHAEAMRLAVKLQNMTLIADILSSCEDEMVKKQMAYMLARYGVRPEAEDELARIMDGAHTTEQYLELARDLDVVEPKTPEDVYKTYLEKRPASSSHIDSARQNLASTFVNAFVNVGFGADKLMLTEGNKWLYKNKEHGMMSAAASLGALLLWDVDGGLSQIDKFLYSSDSNIKAGALLAVGVLNSGVRNECDPALALLTEYVENKAPANIKMGATLGLGLAYAGSAREEVLELLMPLVADIETSLETVAMAALSLGLTYVGTCNEDIAQALLSVLMERDQQVLQKETLTRLICLAIGLLYLGKQQEVEVALELAKVLEGQVGLHCTLTLETCAYAGTGNVLKVQRLLELCGEHLAKDEEDEADAAAPAAAAPAAAGTTEAAAPAAAAAGATGAPAAAGAPAEAKEPKVAVLDHQSVAALGIAMVAMGEELGAEMSLRAYLHMLQYGDPPVRRATPLALALLSASNPSNIIVIDTLSKLSHDQDQEVAINAIIGMGIAAGGTNHSKVSGSLRSLATYYAKEPGVLFAVRLAQGLTHAGKGLITLSPHHPDSSGGVCHPVALASLLVVMHVCMDFKTIVLGKHHFLLWTLVGAMRPRMLVTVDEELKPLPVSVRVGQKVDVVGLAGRPKQITGFQTHTTPVLLAMGEKAELASDEYLPLSTLIEGVVILRKNPDHVPETKTEKK